MVFLRQNLVTWGLPDVVIRRHGEYSNERVYNLLRFCKNCAKDEAINFCWSVQESCFCWSVWVSCSVYFCFCWSVREPHTFVSTDQHGSHIFLILFICGGVMFLFLLVIAGATHFCFCWSVPEDYPSVSTDYSPPCPAS